MTSINLEIPIFGPDSARFAVSAGASRIELNATGSYPAGGLTPTVKDLSQLEPLTVPVRIMIRPRGPPSPPSRDFLYSDAELEAMEQSIRDFKTSGLLKVERGDGFVFGVLRVLEDTGAESTAGMSGGRVALDAKRCRRLVLAAQPLKTVFHRAFDEIVGHHHEGTEVKAHPPEWESALQDLIAFGFDGVLTSGGPGNAIQNVNTLGHILEKAEDRIEIIVGGGVRSSNVRQLALQLKLREKRKAAWVHSSCLVTTGSEQVDINELGGILTQLI